MTRMIRAVVTALLVLLGGAIALPAAATGTITDACTQQVVDQTVDPAQQLDADALAEPLDRAAEIGMDVFVRAFQSTPTEGSLDAYWQQTVVDGCANWRIGIGDSARPKGNLVLVTYSLDDRQSAIFFGSNYNDSIGNVGASELRLVMGEYFRNGDFTGGVADAINGLVDAAMFNGPDGEGVPQEPSAPVDMTPFRDFLAWFIGAIAVVLTLWLGIVLGAKLRREYANRVSEKKAATQVLDNARALFLKWGADKGGLEFVKLELETALRSLPVNRAKHYTKLVEARVNEVQAAVVAYEEAVPALEKQLQQRLTALQFRGLREDVTDVHYRLQSAAEAIEILKVDITQEAFDYSFEGQLNRAEELDGKLESSQSRCQAYAHLFDVRAELTLVARLRQKVLEARRLVEGRTAQDQSHDLLEELERSAAELAGQLSLLQEVADELKDPAMTLRYAYLEARNRFNSLGLRDVELVKPRAQIDDLEFKGDQLLAKFSPAMSAEAQLSALRTHQKSVRKVVEKVEEKQRAKRRREEMTHRRSSSSRYDSSGSSSDAFGGALIGGYLGSSLGSSHSHDSSSSSEWGGGSSGSW